MRDVVAEPSSVASVWALSSPACPWSSVPRTVNSDRPIPDLTRFTSPRFAPGFFSLRIVAAMAHVEPGAKRRQPNLCFEVRAPKKRESVTSQRATMASFAADSETAAEIDCFQLAGAREAVGEERARELVAGVVCASAPTHLKLSNKSFSEGAARIIASALQERCQTVTVADLSDIIAGKSEEEALEVLRIICDSLGGCALVDLNLSDNALGRPGVLACQAVLSGKALQKLYVCNDGLSAEAAETLHEILAKDGMPVLSVFHFYNNMSGDGGAVAVANIVRACPQLVDFRFSATRSQRPGCNAVAQALTTLNSLTSLDLCDCMFAGEAAVHLSKALESQTALTMLNLRDAGLGEEGISAVIRALGAREGAASRGLKFLDVSGCDLDADSAVELARLVSGMSLLEELSVDDNSIESEGISALATVGLAKSSALRSLSVCTCEVTASGAYRLAKTLSKLPTFTTLKLDGNSICSRGVDEVQGLLLRSGKILVEMEDNDDDGDDDLDDAMEEDGGELQDKDEEADDLADALGATKL